MFNSISKLNACKAHENAFNSSTEAQAAILMDQELAQRTVAIILSVRESYSSQFFNIIIMELKNDTAKVKRK